MLFGQLRHFSAPVIGMYDVVLHAVHCTPVSSKLDRYFPASHATQLCAPIFDWREPAGQFVHSVCPNPVAYFPATHAVQPGCAHSATDLAVPGSHGTQGCEKLSSCRAVRMVPGLQTRALEISRAEPLTSAPPTMVT